MKRLVFLAIFQLVLGATPLSATELKFKCGQKTVNYECSAKSCEKAAPIRGYTIFKFDPDQKKGTAQGCDDDGYCTDTVRPLVNVERHPDGDFTMADVGAAFTGTVIYGIAQNRYSSTYVTGKWVIIIFGRCVPIR